MSSSENRSGGPFATSVERIRQEFDQFLDNAVQQGGRVLEGIRTRQGVSWLPPVDLLESTGQIDCFMEVPGLCSEEIDITLAGNMLTITGGKAEPADHGSAVLHLQERRQGRFERSIPMPAAVDPERVSADVTNGVLHVQLPKPSQSVPRQIPVRGGSAPAETGSTPTGG